jgi:MEMO1 family protein
MISAIRQNGNGHKFEMNFVKYAQSSHCVTMKDSSVSYASAALTIK